MSKFDPVLERGMPCDPEAEALIIGCVMLNNELVGQVVEKLMPSDFWFPSNRKIIEQMLALEGEGKPIEPSTIQRRLEAAGELTACGGPAYIASLLDGCPRFSDITNYVDRVEDAAMRRKQIVASNRAIEAAYDFSEPAQVQLNLAQKAICDIQTQSSVAKWYTSGDLAYEAVSRIEERMLDGRLITGIATGYTDFDYMTSGLQKTELYIIGGRPKMGKTAWVSSMLTNAAESDANRRNDQPPVCTFFSLEMSKEKMIERMMSGLSRVDGMRIKSGMLNKADIRALSEAANRLEAMRIEIDDSTKQTPMMIRSKLRQIQQKRGGLDLVVVDYLQMIQPDQRSDSVVREVSEVTRALKAIGKDFNVPVVALASLSRKCEERTDKRPVPSDLRESGNIESDADLIAFIYRDAVYNANAEPNVAELIVRANRNGPAGKVDLIFRGSISRFENMESNYGN